MHVLVKIATLVLLALMLGQMTNPVLFFFAGTLLALGLVVDKQHLMMTIKRVRWLLMVMLGVYVFGTPGQYVDVPFKWLRPTYEGFTLGMQQALKMTTMLAALSLLLSSTSRTQLVSGLYQLMSLFSWTGISAERFTSRLWLTLEYVEQQDKAPVNLTAFKDVFNQLNVEAHKKDYQEQQVELILQPLSNLDKLLLGVMIAFTLWMIWN